ncbi:MAG: AAA family ATPase [Burkholderiales bacterium]|nr:AAA family ATPase [Burkholderiales bacterium]
MSNKVNIRCLPTGLAGFDALLGGGIPEFSFNLIAGQPGTGKTTFAHQLMFALANPDRRALFFNVLGEPALKMLRYQQRFNFFDVDKVDASIRFVSLADDARDGDLDRVLARIIKEVGAFSPGLVFVDSFRSLGRAAEHGPDGGSRLQLFVQQLGLQLTSWQATTFLIGEYPFELDTNPIFAIADGIVWLSQNVHRSSMVRQMQVIKMRGQATIPGLHNFRISDDGITVFSRTVLNFQNVTKLGNERLTMGIPRMDEMLGGGLPSGYSLLIAGPSGSGKSILSTKFLAEGARLGEPGVIAAFEQSPAQSRSRKLDDLIVAGKIGLVESHALDLSIDETVHDLVEMITRMNANRVVIDSLSGFELALAATPREEFRESLYRMVRLLTGMGVTVVMTSELEDRYTDLRFSPYGSAFLTDAIIVQRYIEVLSQVKRVMAVVKVRASMHSRELRMYEIDNDGIVIGKMLPEYEGLLGGRPNIKLSSQQHSDDGKT